ncbi:uncharacterized protein LOC133868895 [Alnus glutinosa]|uniref:uncharacterized protein LOC133868895 n=1 Tax=Alnus glutinosa TaxID=3517 RepID=UPI002D791607|nr:uncharacterized protein LOC133868895 [Alnus glutinosa]
MFCSILTVVAKFYDEWNIQGFILFSVSLQAVLILFAPFRKRTGNVIVLIWVAYLLADWVASFSVGLISNSQKYSRKSDDHSALLAFWAPFLLLHLGSPDTVTAFALEDNVLWKRHMVGLLSQVVTAMIVFSQTLPTNRLWVPTFLMFVAGTIKYSERTSALFLANPNKYRESIFAADFQWDTFEKLMAFLEKYSWKKEEAKLPTDQVGLMVQEPNNDHEIPSMAPPPKPDDVGVVYVAYCLFKMSKGLIVDIILTSFERQESRSFFQERDQGDAFKVLAVELNFMYEVLLYTKVVVVRSLPGYIVRFISWCAVVAALSTFYSIKKHGFGKIDVGITYTLLFGAMGFDTIALFMLAFSDWTAVSMTEYFLRRRDSINTCKAAIGRCFLPLPRCFLPLLRYFLQLKKINWGEDIEEEKSLLGWGRRIIFRRWYESLHTFNLIEYFLKNDIYDRMKYVSKKPLTKKLWVFIFDELKKKSELVDDPDTAKKLYSARGDWVLRQNSSEHGINETSRSNLMYYIIDYDYDESLLLWHIATELCYDHEESHDDSEEDDAKNRREFCKILSDYMLYLLVM